MLLSFSFVINSKTAKIEKLNSEFVAYQYKEMYNEKEYFLWHNIENNADKISALAYLSLLDSIQKVKDYNLVAYNKSIRQQIISIAEKKTDFNKSQSNISMLLSLLKKKEWCRNETAFKNSCVLIEDYKEIAGDSVEVVINTFKFNNDSTLTFKENKRILTNKEAMEFKGDLSLVEAVVLDIVTGETKVYKHD